MAVFLEDCQEHGGFEPPNELVELQAVVVLREINRDIDTILATAKRRRIRQDAILRLVAERFTNP